MTHPQLPNILRDLRRYFDQLYDKQLINLILFGSQAKQEAQEYSDIDVLVVLQGNIDSWTEIKRSGEGVANVCLEYSVVVCCIFISEIQFYSQKTALLRNISREGVIL
jgi:uncharacterized protein